MPDRVRHNLRIFTAGNVLAVIAGVITGHLTLGAGFMLASDTRMITHDVLIPLSRFALATVFEMMPFISWVFMVAIVIVSIPHTRRVAIAEYRFMMAVKPAWLTPLMVVALAIPGPQDEIVLVMIIIVWVMVSSERRNAAYRVAVTAWHG